MKIIKRNGSPVTQLSRSFVFWLLCKILAELHGQFSQREKKSYSADFISTAFTPAFNFSNYAALVCETTIFTPRICACGRGEIVVTTGPDSSRCSVRFVACHLGLHTSALFDSIYTCVSQAKVIKRTRMRNSDVQWQCWFCSYQFCTIISFFNFWLNFFYFLIERMEVREIDYKKWSFNDKSTEKTESDD